MPMSDECPSCHGTGFLLQTRDDGVLASGACDCQLVDRAEIEANEWSRTPGRYVYVSPEEVDEDFDF